MFNLSKLFSNRVGQDIPNKELLDALSVKRDWSAIYINKGKGKTKKKIYVPGDSFKNALRIVLKDFQQKAVCHEAVYSYQVGLSFIDLANEHTGSQYLFKTDINSFFDNISQDEVKKCLAQYYDPSLANKLSSFVCYESKLPFGSPFSPYFSNIYLKPLDELMSAVCSDINTIYTRYSDDIYISSDDKQALEGLGSTITNVLKETYPSLSLNTSKTIIFSSPFHMGPFTVQKQYGVNLCKSYKRLIRVKLHKYSTLELDDRELPSLKGLLLFLKGNDPKYFEKLSVKFPLEIDEIISMPS